ncbi:MAG: NAD-dependent epimerase/dehydratase family protein [Cryomorphaceae bacterium]|jgi:dTDP-glucose 4,6-dehydratase/UDP-glucose 4-epimerase|nr:NAD-dependent epimerase/dehydratase family protein [Cryomorphaceae bacterium]
MNILIIGSEGFIGSNCERYFSKNHSVLSCDVIELEKKNYFNLEHKSFQSIIGNHNIHVCINCSGSSNVAESYHNPQNDFQLNTKNVGVFLDAIRLSQPECKFINLSSAAVYGNPTELPVSEKTQIAPISNYGFHKVYAEQICNQYSQVYNVKTISIRIFSAYGPGLKKQLLWDIYQKAKNNQDQIELFGTGMETRDFIFIEDIVEAVELLIGNAEFKGEAYNLASGVEIKINEVSKLLLEKLNWKGEVFFNNKELEGYPKYWKSEISKIKKIGFVPKVNLINGIEETVKWMNQL